ncbi:murein hydrolase activator EnvC family protein [Parabacteroides sp. FAFU027]|uniref:murein hydrolase activator EnvC family protein n=1 Tax=Parabacteroides sp. FAFU027 TaxID=2922715 RepID=UPI001FAF8A04|nr:M23 family metallopeptidase [Parabacteroides sp. FAFU027]
MAKKKRGKTFWQHIRFQYKLSILNEKTLEEVWAYKLSLLSAFWAGLALFIFAVLIVSTLIVYTPIKNFLPGYLDVKARNDIQNNALRLDSLEEQISNQDKYLANLKGVLRGDIKLDSISVIDSLISVSPENVKASKAELAYRAQYEEDEKYNLSIQPKSSNGEKSIVFTRPVKGVISQNFNPSIKQFGIAVAANANSPVMSVLEGNVIQTGYLPNGTEFIQVQHTDGYISIYKNCSRILKSPGDNVHAGEALGTTATSSDKKSIPVIIEIWYKGKPVNPSQYIVF